MVPQQCAIVNFFTSCLGLISEKIVDRNHRTFFSQFITFNTHEKLHYGNRIVWTQHFQYMISNKISVHCVQDKNTTHQEPSTETKCWIRPIQLWAFRRSWRLPRVNRMCLYHLVWRQSVYHNKVNQNIRKWLN